MIDSKMAPLKVILCGATMQFILKTMFLPFASHAGGFEVLSLVTTLQAMAHDVKAYCPDVLVIESSIAPSIDELQSVLTQIVKTTPITIVLVLTEECPPITYQFGGIERVKIWFTPVDWKKVAESTYSFTSEQKASLRGTVVDETRDLLFLKDEG